jgi:hypothetical protein
MGKWRYSFKLLVGGEQSASGPGKSPPYFLNRKLSGPQNLSGRCGENKIRSSGKN